MNYRTQCITPGPASQWAPAYNGWSGKREMKGALERKGEEWVECRWETEWTTKERVRKVQYDRKQINRELRGEIREIYILFQTSAQWDLPRLSKYCRISHIQKYKSDGEIKDELKAPITKMLYWLWFWDLCQRDDVPRVWFGSLFETFLNKTPESTPVCQNWPMKN